MNERLLKQERSIPVQARIDISSLADMLLYFESAGLRINTMSMLLSTCVDYARQLAEVNLVLPKVHESVADANRTLNERGLYQSGMMKRGGREKLATAMKFENLRLEGIDPEKYVTTHYNIVHNTHSVEPPSIDIQALNAGIKKLSNKAIKDYKDTYEPKVNIESALSDMKRLNENYIADERGGMVLREPLTAKLTIQQPTIAIESKRDPSVVDNLQTDVLEDLKKGKKDSDIARQSTSSELEDKAIALKKKDRDIDKLFREAVPEATAVE